MEIKCTLKLKFALVNNSTYYRIHSYIHKFQNCHVAAKKSCGSGNLLHMGGW